MIWHLCLAAVLPPQASICAVWFDVVQVTAALCVAGDGSGPGAGRHGSPVSFEKTTDTLAGQQDTPHCLCLPVHLKGEGVLPFVKPHADATHV